MEIIKSCGKTDVVKEGKHTKKVSVIVPVYRAERYLKMCLDSIVRQSYQNLEIILIEDGSPDRCGKICEEYAKKDSRVRVLHERNQGVSMARNAGLAIASGTYVQFVDSDDRLALHMIEKLVDALEDSRADLVICGFYEENTNFKRISKTETTSGMYGKKRFLKEIMKQPYSFQYGVLWNKLFKREKIGELQFLADLDFGEDFIFNLYYLGGCNQIQVLEEPLYYYRRYNKDSLMYRQAKGKKEEKKYLQYMEKSLFLFTKYKQFYQEQGFYERYARQIEEYLLRVYVSERIEIKSGQMTSEQKKRCLALLKKRKEIKCLKKQMGIWAYGKKTIQFSVAKYKVKLRDILAKN